MTVQLALRARSTAHTHASKNHEKASARDTKGRRIPRANIEEYSRVACAPLGLAEGTYRMDLHRISRGGRPNSEVRKKR